MAKKKIERIGETVINKFGSVITLIEYNEANDITVKFDNGYIVKTIYDSFSKGKLEDVFEKTIYGIGYLGNGKYKTRFGNKNSKQYSTWHCMLTRCYSEEYHLRQPTYIGCTVCEEWHNFQNFAKWYDENYYEIDNIENKMQLDKDILFKRNKIYSPDTCCFVPKRINVLFQKTNKKRGNLPIGVSLNKITNKEFNKYISSANNKYCKKVTIGYFSTPEEAFRVYKNFKENVLKEVADEYKGNIPQKLYEAMYNYEVDITD